jgi:hypothetical protein
MRKKGEGKKRGPRSGVKHQPGRGHQRKSKPQKAKRYKRKAAKRRREEEEAARRQWEQLTDEQKKFRFDLEPSMPRPSNG